ncbi:MAG TPA: HAD family hydrolase [Allosphingosinicella sp.]|nr:HAD family hydrolase [Allosphingosinicella sp.]
MAKAVLFDVDGTLIDSNDLHAAAWVETFKRFGFDVPFETARSQIGKGGDNLIPSLIPSEKLDGTQEEMEDYRSDLFQRCYLPRVVPFPGVRELFERLVQDGVKIVLASSAKSKEVDYHLGIIGASDLVHATTSADDVESSKPDPDIFQAALDKVSPLTTEDVVVVGDTPWDVKAACKAGLRTIAVRSGGFPDEELLEAGASSFTTAPRTCFATTKGRSWPMANKHKRNWKYEKC